MQKKIFYIFIFSISLCAIIYFFKGATHISADSLIIKEYKETRNSNVNFALEIPETLYFAGESVPIERLDVRESLDRELLVNTYWHSQTFLFFKRANRYFPVIEPILKKNNIPDDFKYLSLIESGFSNVVSPSGAVGFWQLLKVTGEKWGLIINDEVDERYNFEKSTEAACKYLNNSYNIFKNWTLAAAAYNMGDAGLGNQMKNQKVYNFYDIYLNSETARYIYRILAVKTIFENPGKYGFYFKKSDLYPPVKTQSLVVDTSITDLAQFALDNGINYKILKEYNPWLRKISLINKTKNSFFIQIPYKDELLYNKHFPKRELNKNDD